MAKPKRKRRKGKSTGSQRSGAARAGAPKDMPELQKARALWLQKRFGQSLALFDKAVRKDPTNPLALVDAARAYGARFEVGRAERILERLLEIGGRRADVLHMAGQSFRMTHRPDRAIHCFENVLALSADSVDSALELAILYERRGRLDDALATIDACLQTKPNYVEATLIRARILRRLGRATECEHLRRDLTQAERAHWIVRSQAWSDLGQLYDKQREFDAAFAAVLECKTILRKEESDAMADAKTEEQRLDAFLDDLTGAHFERWRDNLSSVPEHRVAMLTGPPRSGTTLLEKVLDSHPDVISSDEREAFPKFVLPALLMGIDRSLAGPARPVAHWNSSASTGMNASSTTEPGSRDSRSTRRPMKMLPSRSTGRRSVAGEITKNTWDWRSNWSIRWFKYWDMCRKVAITLRVMWPHQVKVVGLRGGLETVCGFVTRRMKAILGKQVGRNKLRAVPAIQAFSGMCCRNCATTCSGLQ